MILPLAKLDESLSVLLGPYSPLLFTLHIKANLLRKWHWPLDKPSFTVMKFSKAVARGLGEDPILIDTDLKSSRLMSTALNQSNESTLIFLNSVCRILQLRNFMKLFKHLFNRWWSPSNESFRHNVKEYFVVHDEKEGDAIIFDLLCFYLHPWLNRPHQMRVRNFRLLIQSISQYKRGWVHDLQWKGKPTCQFVPIIIHGGIWLQFPWVLCYWQ